MPLRRFPGTACRSGRPFKSYTIHTEGWGEGFLDIMKADTRAKHNWSLFPLNYSHQGLLDVARKQAKSPEAYRDRRRRKHLAEGSFADAANNYHFKRSRWRRLWRQQIQDFMIGAIQNVKILLKHGPRHPAGVSRQVGEQLNTFMTRVPRFWRRRDCNSANWAINELSLAQFSYL